MSLKLSIESSTEHMLAFDEQAAEVLEAALLVPNLRLHSVSRLGVYMHGCSAAYDETPLAPEQGARGVINQIGVLVSNRVLPSLKQVSAPIFTMLPGPQRTVWVSRQSRVYCNCHCLPHS